MSTELDLAQQVLELVRARAGAGVEAEVGVDRQALALTRFANSAIHQNVAEDVTTVQLRLHADGRTATGSTTVTGPDGVRELVDHALGAVRVAPTDPGWPGLAPPAALAGEGDFDEQTAAASPAQRAAQVRAFVDAAGDAPAAGYCRTRQWQGAFANSAGQSVTARTTEAALDGVARRPGGDGVARLAAVRLADLDGAGLGTRAAAKAHAATDPVELPPGRYEVVLEPCAVADVLGNLAVFGFNGKAYAERRSFAELGAAQFDASVTLVEDPFAAGNPARAFDTEGTPRQRLTLVEGGVTTAVTHSRRTAALAGEGARTTGHGTPLAMTAGAVALNLGLLPAAGEPPEAPAGTAPALVDPAAAGLVPGVERGLLVTDLWYTRVLDPKSLVMTGLTRNGVWLIEDGRVTAPVQNLRFTQSYPQALGPGAVRGIGPAATLLPIPWGLAWWRAPALHLASWHFTGGASG